MPIFDLPTEEGTIRVTAESAREATQLVMQGHGTLLPAHPERPISTPTPQLHAEPPRPPDATVYNPGATSPPATPGQGLLSPGSGGGLRQMLVDLGKRVALPTAGSLALGVGGQFVPGLNAVPAPLREAAGSMLGTGANMALGIEAPSWEQLLVSGMAPASARGGASLATKALPGAAAARAVGLAEEARQLPEILARGVTVDPASLFDYARKLNPAIKLDSTGATAKQLIEQESTAIKGLKFSRVNTVAGELAELAAVTPETKTVTLAPLLDDLGMPIASTQVLHLTPAKDGTIPLEQLDLVRQRIGALIGLTKDPQEQAAYKQLYGSFLTDLEQAATRSGGEGAQALIMGIRQQRRAFAADDLEALVSSAISQPRPVDGLQTVNTGRLLKAIESPTGQGQDLLRQFLEQHPGERQEILDLLRDMNRRNVKLLPPSGSMFGSGPTLARAGGAAALAKATGLMDPTVAAGLATMGSQLISRALLTDTGRAFLRQALADGPTLNMTQLLVQMAGQGLRGSLGSTPLTTGAQGAMNVGRQLFGPSTPATP